MSQEEINLLCTNMGLISPMRVCVRVRVSAGGVATAQNAQLNGRVPLRACVREGGTGLLVQFQERVISPLRACVREGGVA